jgi:hypothetical protein
MKRVLIISPNFPPVNAADMHRVRQSLPYFKEFGWEPVVIAVDERYVESYSIDPLLIHTIPADVEIHKVKAFDVRRTRKFGLGSLSMRSYLYFKRKGDELLKARHFDLVYFSTTAFHVMALGPRWKRKFGVPFVLDIQDPWRSDFYLDKPKSERPPKFRITHTIDKYLEARTVPNADGIISVSQGYCEMFLQRYPTLNPDLFKVITFGAAPGDFTVMADHIGSSERVRLDPDKKNIVYIGRGGHDMRFALDIIFGAFKKGLAERKDIFSRSHLWFIGTSYLPAGQGNRTIFPIAEKYGIGDHVTEITDRIPYFETLFLLKKADMLLVPGSTDTMYTASKIFPYILAARPLLAVFYKESSVMAILDHIGTGTAVRFDHLHYPPATYVEECKLAFERCLEKGNTDETPDDKKFVIYTAREKTRQQTDFFDRITSDK